MNKSDIYAERDGIKVTLGKGRGYSDGVKTYHVPCDKCGKIVKRLVYNGDQENICPACRLGIKRKRKIAEQNDLDHIVTKHEKRFDKAVERIKAQVKRFDKYDKAISLARRRCEQYGSIPEAMVAIELVRLGHSVIPQQKIGRYRVDFLLKDVKMVIEVDGSLFHRDKYKGDREAFIQTSLGFDWAIVHIPAELIEKDIVKLSKIIKTFKKDETRGKT